MRRIHILFLAGAVAFAPTLAFADESDPGSETLAADPAVATEEAAVPSAAPIEEAGELAWDQFDDPEFDPATAAAQDDPAASVADEQPAEAELATDVREQNGIELTEAPEFEVSHGVMLGPVGVDDEGRTGRLHTVATGDTLWDLSAAYLGTAWVWPSVWTDNKEIENPHLIVPGDKIWITANEMRVVSDAQAESFLAPSVVDVPVAADESMAIADDADLRDAAEMAPMDDVEAVSPVAALEVEVDDPSTLESFPVSVVGQEPETMASGLQITISQRDAMGFVSADDLAGATSIVDSTVERTFLAAGDPVVLGMGEGDVEIGDQFTIFRVVEEVRDVDTNRILGHHVDVLGWIEVRELTGDTSIAEIRTSYSEMRRGVRVMRRPILPRHVTARTTPDAIEGNVVFLPGERTVMADGGYVYLNRGEFHGVEVGSELEVFEPGTIINDRSRRVDVRTPDHSVARLVVVSVMSESSVAFILTSNRELEVGDEVRPRVARLAQR